MYCIKCGVKLCDSEKKCPLCGTVVCHPDFDKAGERPIYPENKKPKVGSGAKALNGAIIFLFFIPLLVCFFADYSLDGKIEWFGFVAGAMLFSYVCFALPLWFKKPNPVIFVPCDFAAAALYLCYINYATNGDWFLSIALPAVCGIGIITTAVVTLTRYLRRGRLYIFGGAFMALGALMPFLEFSIKATFDLAAIGWSIYPLVVLFLFGGLLIYLAINGDAREMIERKLFF